MKVFHTIKKIISNKCNQQKTSIYAVLQEKNMTQAYKGSTNLQEKQIALCKVSAHIDKIAKEATIIVPVYHTETTIKVFKEWEQPNGRKGVWPNQTVNCIELNRE